MQSYEKRFEGHEDEIRNDLALLGESPTADKWQAIPGLAFHSYATKLLGHRPEYATKFAHSDAGQLAHYIVADILGRLQAQNDEITRLREELASMNGRYEAEKKRIKMSGVNLVNYLAQER